MGKGKTKHPVVSEAAAQLTHNPFAALAAKTAAPAPQPLAASVDRVPRKPPGRLVLRRETKHRAGKAVIVITGFDALLAVSDSELEALAKQLKQVLGCGGTVEGREILLQGDRAAQVAALLRAQGYRVDGVTS